MSGTALLLGETLQLAAPQAAAAAATAVGRTSRQTRTFQLRVNLDRTPTIYIVTVDRSGF